MVPQPAFVGPPGHFNIDGWDNFGFFVRVEFQREIEEEAHSIVEQTMDIVQVPRSLPSVRKLLLKVLQLNILNIYSYN